MSVVEADAVDGVLTLVSVCSTGARPVEPVLSSTNGQYISSSFVAKCTVNNTQSQFHSATGRTDRRMYSTCLPLI